MTADHLGGVAVSAYTERIGILDLQKIGQLIELVRYLGVVYRDLLIPLPRSLPAAVDRVTINAHR
jgi:hypothetical protein